MYCGNGAYCYANTTAMLLASIGESVSPSTVEVLTGVGMGAFWIPQSEGILFGAAAPNEGVSSALDLLGFGREERRSADGDPLPLEELREALRHGPVAIGPVDMGCLTYMPSARGPNGVDHFVLLHGLEGDEVCLHDPAGYPHVSLPLADLERAWRAERIGYRRGAFERWYAPRRRETVSDEELFGRALARFGQIYARQGGWAESRGWLAGPRAVREHAAQVRAGCITPTQLGHMTHFVYQLGAKRALDYAAFFAGRREDLAALKGRQAVRFGRAHTLAVRKAWAPLAETLEEIAAIEDELGAALAG